MNNDYRKQTEENFLQTTWNESLKPLVIAISPFVGYALAPTSIHDLVFGAILGVAILYNILNEIF